MKCLLSFVLLPCVAVLVIASPALAGGVNLLANPGFEDSGGSYDGWITFGNGPNVSTPGTDNIFRSGSAAAKVFGEFNSCPIPTFDVGGFYQFFTPTAGELYEFSGYSYVSSGDPIPGTDTCNRNRCIAKVVFFDAPVGGNEISSNEVIVGDGNTPTDQWIDFSVSAPAPASAMRVEAMILFLQPGCDTGAVFVDDVSFCELPPPAPLPNLLLNPSFDVDLTGWTTFGNALHEGLNIGIRTVPGAAKLFGTFTPGADSGMFQSFAASPGSNWTLDLYAMTTCWDPLGPTSDVLAIAKIVFRDASNNEIGSSETVIADNTSPLGTWTQHTVTFGGGAPAATVAVEAFILFIQPSGTGVGSVFVDDVSFRQEFTVPVAFHGFDVRAGSEGIDLNWEVLDAFEVVGYNVYRSDDAGTSYQKLNASGMLPRETVSYLDATVRPGREYAYMVGAVEHDGEILSISRTASVKLFAARLEQNNPNPFNPVTTITFLLPSEQVVRLSIYDAGGRLVKKLFEGEKLRGENRVTWDGTNASGNRVGSGVYYYRLKAGQFTDTKKMVLLK